MTEEVTETVEFLNGHPSFTYDQVYRCFKGDNNGLLFRLVNNSNHKWAFYNDSKDMVMHVKAHFSADSKVRAAGRAQATAMPTDASGQLQETIVSVEIQPRMTEVFIDGEVNGFALDFQTEQMAATNVKFMNQRATLPHYTKVYKCFKNEGNGLFFRLVDEDAGKWYYYNDTKDFMMSATVTFQLTEQVTPVGETFEVQAEDPQEEVAYQITVAPGNCEPFIEGAPVAYHQSFNAEPIDENCLDPQDVQFENGEPDHNIVDLTHSKIYKCFRDNGNGLLFRIVDQANKLWAYYNDTTEYVMLPKVRFFGPQDIALSPDAQIAEKDADSYAATIEVKPLQTVHFLNGLPTKFEFSVVAESVNKAVPEANPDFQTGEPDRAVMNYDEVFECFKDKPEARLFRLVDTRRHRWGFFNDTENLEFTATFSFDSDGPIMPLGTTKEDGESFIVSIPPQTTVAYVQGSIKGFKSKFTGRRSANSVTVSSHSTD